MRLRVYCVRSSGAARASSRLSLYPQSPLLLLLTSSQAESGNKATEPKGSDNGAENSEQTTEDKVNESLDSKAE